MKFSFEIENGFGFWDFSNNLKLEMKVQIDWWTAVAKNEIRKDTLTERERVCECECERWYVCVCANVNIGVFETLSR